MYSIYRTSKSSLQRGAHLVNIGLLGNQRSYVRPLILQTVHYSKSTDSDIEKKPLLDKTPIVSKEPVKGKSSGPPKIEMTIVPASYHNLSYEELNAKLGRELAPHLTIYKIQLTSAMSIFLRISGFVLGIGFWIMGLTGLFCDMDINAMANKIEECELGRNFFRILKFVIILPFAYHMVVGTRHLIFYLNVFLSKKGIYATGYVALALTLIMAATLAGINLEDEKNKLTNVSNEGALGSELQNLVNDESNESGMKSELKQMSGKTQAT